MTQQDAATAAARARQLSGSDKEALPYLQLRSGAAAVTAVPTIWTQMSAEML